MSRACQSVHSLVTQQLYVFELCFHNWTNFSLKIFLYLTTSMCTKKQQKIEITIQKYSDYK